MDSDPRQRIARILWAAILTSQGMFVFVLYFLQHSGSLPTSPETPHMSVALGAVSVGIAAMSVILPKQIFGKALLAARHPIEERHDPDAVGMYRDSAPKIRVFSDAKHAEQRAWSAYQPALIIGIALCEAITLNGFVLAFLGYGAAEVAPFFAVGMTLTAARFPRRATIVAALEKAYDAKLMA
jgi:hypothetical protein